MGDGGWFDPGWWMLWSRMVACECCMMNVGWFDSGWWIVDGGLWIV